MFIRERNKQTNCFMEPVKYLQLVHEYWGLEFLNYDEVFFEEP